MPDALPTDGYLTDSAGRLVPVANVKAEHLLEDEIVRELDALAQEETRRLADLKATAFEKIGILQELLAQKYGAKAGGAKGNLTLNSYDGSIRVQVAVGDTLSFGPELQAAKALIDDCLDRWSEGANPHIRTIVHDAFDIGKEGKLRVDRILALRRLNIDDEAWVNAMAAIGDAIRSTHSKQYVRFYRRNAEGQYGQIALDLAKA